MKFLFFLLLITILALPASSDVIKIATWNIEHLRASEGKGSKPEIRKGLPSTGEIRKTS